MEIAAPYMVLMSRSQERGCWRLIIKGDWLARAPHRGGGEEERGEIGRERKWEAKVIAKPSLSLYWLESPSVQSLQKMSIPTSRSGPCVQILKCYFLPKNTKIEKMRERSRELRPFPSLIRVACRFSGWMARKQAESVGQRDSFRNQQSIYIKMYTDQATGIGNKW